MDKFMQAAIEEAKLGLAEGGIPIGSVLVIDGEKPCAEQAAGAEIKRCGALLLQPLLDDDIRIPIAKRLWFEMEGSRGMDDLHHLASMKTEGGA